MGIRHAGMKLSGARQPPNGPRNQTIRTGALDVKVLVFGGGGKTGALVVDLALEKGHEVTVLVRNSSAYRRTGVRVVAGDATAAADVRGAMGGQDAVIDALGGTTPYKTQMLERTAARSIVDAMRHEVARRLVVVSMMGLGASRTQAPLWYRYLLMTTFLRGSTADKRAMEAVVSESGLEYVIVRPPLLNDGPSAGRAIVLAAGTGHDIVRADLAAFLVEQLTDDAYVGRAITVVGR